MTGLTSAPRIDGSIMSDGLWTGSVGREIVSRSTTGLQDLASDVADTLMGASWSYMLQAEFEDALDTALFRAALADTPTLSGAAIIGLC